MPRRLANMAETAEYMCTNVTRIRELRRKNLIPIIKIGGRVMVDLDAIDRWLDDCAQGPRVPSRHDSTQEVGQ